MADILGTPPFARSKHSITDLPYSRESFDPQLDHAPRFDLLTVPGVGYTSLSLLPTGSDSAYPDAQILAEVRLYESDAFGKPVVSIFLKSQGFMHARDARMLASLLNRAATMAELAEGGA
jgi:hypothetical protein